MIKEIYLGWALTAISRHGSGWSCVYRKGDYTIGGAGHNIESATADAQKQIKIEESK